MSRERLTPQEKVSLLSSEFTSSITNLQFAYKKEMEVRRQFNSEVEKGIGLPEASLREAHMTTAGAKERVFGANIAFHELLRELEPGNGLRLTIELKFSEKLPDMLSARRFWNFLEALKESGDHYGFNGSYLNPQVSVEVFGEGLGYNIMTESEIDNSERRAPMYDDSTIGAILSNHLAYDHLNDRSYFITLQHYEPISDDKLTPEGPIREELADPLQINLLWVSKVRVDLIKDPSRLKQN